MSEVTLTEEFDNPRGTWANYDAYQETDRTIIANQAHVDIRDLRGVWTGGTVASDAARGNFKVLAHTLATGANALTSVDIVKPVDIDTGFDDADFISIALPSFPLGQVTQATSFVDLTSEPTGAFTSQTASVAFSASSPALVNGDSEFRVTRGAFRQNNIDFTHITGVRIRTTATGAATLRVMAVRLLSKNWTLPSIDFNTRSALLQRSVSRTGDIVASTFAVPVLWRAAVPSGEDDPRPIDGEFAVIFNTGSLTQSNQFTLYFREVTEDFMTQLDLDGMTMGELDGNVQPDTGEAKWSGRTMQDLAQYTQAELEGQSQYSLSRVPDFLSASWLQFVCQWQGATGSISILDTEGNGYTLPLLTPFVANTRYVFYASLFDNTARVTIYTLDASGNVAAQPIFDSSAINDDISFPRRKGRFGWFAKFLDGDAYIESISNRRVNFAEYRSFPFESVTPVIGAELFVSNSAPIEHYETLLPGPHNAPAASIVAPDNSRSTTGASWQVANLGTTTRQGVQTNLFTLSNFEDTTIRFDLYWTSAAGPLLARLITTDGLREVPLLLPRLTPDQWQSIKIKLPFNQNLLGGRYNFGLWQQNATVANWWIDNVAISERSVSWEGRAVVDDPWLANIADWIPFGDNLNKENGGVLFSQRGNKLQVRAKAHRQSAYIDSIKFKPKYAELGHFTFKPAPVTIPPVANFSQSIGANRTVTFTSTATDADGIIVNNEWTFGDGTAAIGSPTVHQYATTGIYTVTLTVTDNNGNRVTQVGSVGV